MPAGNPNIAEANKGTRFQPGNKIQKLGKPWSIRSMLRYHGGSTEEPTEEMLKRMTPAQRIALKLLKQAEEGNVRAVRLVINYIDGPVVQPNLNVYHKRLQAMSDDELTNESLRLEAELARFQI